VQLDEKITWEHWLARVNFAAVVPLLDGQRGQIAGKTLSLEVLECAKFLATLALDDVPPTLAHL
jgi:hypothetical protein